MGDVVNVIYPRIGIIPVHNGTRIGADDLAKRCQWDVNDPEKTLLILNFFHFRPVHMGTLGTGLASNLHGNVTVVPGSKVNFTTINLLIAFITVFSVTSEWQAP